eukprot:Hpha_TRINITY_DN14931_c0_g2::TRINITY_DN14931_c0_g2_i2::g.144892::m.144892/K00297/metF, MTHFR; methylenetetrahydrofolate reductase (NADPH)
MKIIDKIRDTLAHERLFYSFEFFLPKTDAGTLNLFDRVERMKELKPSFVSITCDPCPPWDTTLDLCSTVQNLIGLETQMHICCGSTTIEVLARTVQKAREMGIQNLFVLRGRRDPSGKEQMSVAEFVRWLRKEHGDYFGISVAAYIDGHEESRGREEDILHLKEKIDAGADLVITQACYDAERFSQFEADCKKHGINCPVIPGVMPVNTYHQFSRQMRAFKHVPGYTESTAVKELKDKLSSVQQDDDEVKKVGMQQLSSLITRLMRKRVRGFHFFTQNLETSTRLILTSPPPQGLGLLGEELCGLPYAAPDEQRDMPWRQSANSARLTEEVRPAFWANRPKSYIARTSDWDDFPNGRWGDSRSPAFGDLDYSGVVGENARAWLSAKAGPWPLDSDEKRLAMQFVVSLYEEAPTLPWFESKLSPETTHGETNSILSEVLDPMNRRCLLTINSQPPVNAAPSDDRVVGWGPRGGYVFQKEYVEFFCSPASADIVMEVLNNKTKYANLSWIASNRAGDKTSISHSGTNAVTWGVFPGREVAQPTIVDPVSFAVWRQEAFDLWIVPYRPGQEEYCPGMIQEVVKSWWLINIVDNDFVKQTELRQALQEIMDKIPPLIAPGEKPKLPKNSSWLDELSGTSPTGPLPVGVGGLPPEMFDSR